MPVNSKEKFTGAQVTNHIRETLTVDGTVICV